MCVCQGLTILADDGEALGAACAEPEALLLRSCTLEAPTFLPTLATSSDKLQRLVLVNLRTATGAASASLAALGTPGSLPALKEFEVGLFPQLLLVIPAHSFYVATGVW